MNTWQVGYAQCDITPAKGTTLMAGYGQERYAQGTLTPLRAQALALAAGSQRALLLTADVLGFDRVAAKTLRHALYRSHGLKPSQVILAASHTHWGPGISFRVNFTASGLDAWYRKRLEESLLQLAAAAWVDLRPATIAYDAMETRIGCNRRLPGPGRRVEWGPNPQGSYDAHTPILQIMRDGTHGASSPRQLVLIGHACHPTSTGMTPKWSAEYPGALRDRLEKTLGPDSRSLFVMGCGADAKVCHLDPKTRQPAFSASPDQARAAGRQLAGAVLRHLQSATPENLPAALVSRLAQGRLSFAKARSIRHIEKMAFDGQANYADALWARQSLAYPDTRRFMPYEVTRWTLGSRLSLLALEGEVCSPLGPLARALAATPLAMTLAYANAVEGYIPSQRIVQEGGYEGESSHRAYFLPAPFTRAVEREFAAVVQAAVGSAKATPTSG